MNAARCSQMNPIGERTDPTVADNKNRALAPMTTDHKLHASQGKSH